MHAVLLHVLNCHLQLLNKSPSSPKFQTVMCAAHDQLINVLHFSSACNVFFPQEQAFPLRKLTTSSKFWLPHLKPYLTTQIK